MTCNTCQKYFGLLTRELACPKCGYSYCKSCLKYKWKVPNTGQQKKICGPCFNKSSRSNSHFTNDLTPGELTKKLEYLENPAKPPIVLYKGPSKLDELGKNLDPADKIILDRLKNLKGMRNEVGPVPTEDEIRQRLAQLRDQHFDSTNQPKNVYQADTRSDQQKADDLITEYLGALALNKNTEEAASNIDQVIQSRLDRLRGVDSSKYSNTNVMDYKEQSEEDETRKIIEEALARARLMPTTDKDSDLDEDLNKTSSEDDETECMYCNTCEDCKDLVWCHTCEKKVQCRDCFEDNHDEEQIETHKVVPYFLRPRVSSSKK
ncbi:hypothetical protein TKK_0000081 [Trichogramma kaykai]|uniref:FYVE-type domain-containing protein n=1 Tax=Trichogramma kaykai TaxID=54128 RepID=A0ABD2VU44_9HYME